MSFLPNTEALGGAGLIFLEEHLYALIYEVLIGVTFMSSSGDKSIACIIEREHPIISRKSCVIDVLL
jgi:hypothetical protein